GGGCNRRDRGCPAGRDRRLAPLYRDVCDCRGDNSGGCGLAVLAASAGRIAPERARDVVPAEVVEWTAERRVGGCRRCALIALGLDCALDRSGQCCLPVAVGRSRSRETVTRNTPEVERR